MSPVFPVPRMESGLSEIEERKDDPPAIERVSKSVIEIVIGADKQKENGNPPNEGEEKMPRRKRRRGRKRTVEQGPKNQRVEVQNKRKLM